MFGCPRRIEGFSPLKLEVQMVFELPDVGAKIETWVLWKSK